MHFRSTFSFPKLCILFAQKERRQRKHEMATTNENSAYNGDKIMNIMEGSEFCDTENDHI
jgi:hypothetical protein